MPELVTRVTVEELPAASSDPITVMRFSGDITSASQPAVMGTYEGLPDSVKRILLDFSKVEYLNSSGIAHFKKVFTMVGITKYTTLHEDEASACAAF